TTQLVGVVGEEAAQKLIAYFKGEKINIPKGDKALRCARNRLILAECDAGGVTLAELALKYGLTTRQIVNILGKPIQADAKQLVLELGWK
ncbi:MAG: hypothetical protein HQM02_08615, partial [Magnetococcales bacterium]|nr:hypothetical protein [Magnetococcales bacterium]